MNRSFRSVWSQATGTWVAVSEITAARGKRSSALVACVVGAGLSAMASISGAQVVNYVNGDNNTAPIVIVDPAATLNLASGTATQSGDISGAGGIIKNAAGVLVLSGNNTYTGTTTVLGGALQVATDSQLGSGGAGIVLDGGGLRIGADNFSSTRGITLGAGGGTIDVNGTADNTLSGQITGKGQLTIANSGTNTLGQETRRLTIDNATNNYTGGTRVQGNGVSGRTNLWTNTAGSFGTGPIDIYDNAEVRFQGAAASAGALTITTQTNTNLNGSNSGIQFQMGASAGKAQITTGQVGSYVLFGQDTTAAQSTIQNNGGRVIFNVNSSGGSAVIQNNGGGVYVQNSPDLSGATFVNNNDTVNARTGLFFINDVATSVAVGSISGTG
ncbi:MAG: ESPR domain-containing protein, partial [Gammaproteobacteria bacterium]|nr:ESPR domain-containing protein [Gammaproteobacteria bacterium]